MVQNKKRYKIVIVEPSPIVAIGLKSLIEEMKDFEVTSVVTDNCNYYVERIISADPDIVILNPTIQDYKSRSNVEDIVSRTGCNFVVALVSQLIDDETLKEYHAVLELYDNTDKISFKLKKLINTEKHKEETYELTSREKEILVCISKGMMNKEMAEKLNLSIHTIITHRKNITKKTGIKSVSGLTVFAILNNLIDIQEIE